MKLRTIIIASASSVFFISSVAAQETSTFGVTAEVVDSCDVTATALAFGNVDPVTGTQTDSISTVTVTCSNGTAYNIGLGGGTGTIAARTLTDGVEVLNYNLYQEAAHTNVWGETEGTDTVADTGSGTALGHTVYGQVVAGQDTVPTGSYSDTITVTVTF